jgi:hypothetical protein
MTKLPSPSSSFRKSKKTKAVTPKKVPSSEMISVKYLEVLKLRQRLSEAEASRLPRQ